MYRDQSGEDTMPTSFSYNTGHTIRDGEEGEVLAFIETGCDTCGTFLDEFNRVAQSSHENVRFAVVPFAGSSPAARERARKVECAAVEGVADAALTLGFHVKFDLPADQFAAAIGIRNIPDFSLCVREGRFDYAVDRAASLAHGEGDAATALRVRGPARLENALAQSLAPLGYLPQQTRPPLR